MKAVRTFVLALVMLLGITSGLLLLSLILDRIGVPITYMPAFVAVVPLMLGVRMLRRRKRRSAPALVLQATVYRNGRRP
jgi:CHASE2 domain-containing sensor protein